MAIRMKVWSFIAVGVLTLAIGFGAGYYTKTVAYGRNEMQNQAQGGSLVSEPTPGTEATSTPQSVDRTPSPTPSMTPTATPSASPQGTEANAPGDVLMSPTPQMGKENVYYMLKDYFGKIAIYKVYPSGESTLMSIVDIDINSLPEKDREHLQKGIGVTTEEEMLQLIEDYMS